MMNPVQFVKMMRGGNPQKVVMDMMREQAGNNPVMRNAMQMAEKGDSEGNLHEIFVKNRESMRMKW